MQIGDKVRLFLDEEIAKAEKAKSKKPYAHPFVVDIWKKLNGRIGVVIEIDGSNIWVVGPRGKPRMFREDVLKLI